MKTNTQARLARPSSVIELGPRFRSSIQPDPDQEVDVVVIGHTGKVGSELVERLQRLDHGQHALRLVFSEGINRSSHLLAHRRDPVEHKRDRSTLAGLGCRLVARKRPAVIVDCTADALLPRHYPEWLNAGIAVVTPNKHGFAGSLELYRSIHQAAREGRVPLGYSATVGAGLPILSSLRRLRQAGKRPESISAVVSGTLSHVFSRMSAGLTLSAAVADAQARGFTEPDPLEDLSGRDVERKLLIMLRELGLEEWEPSRRPVVEDEWAQLARHHGDVIEALRDQDPGWKRRLDSARQKNKTLVYLAQAGPGGAQVGPVEVERDSAFARLEGSANLATIRLEDDPQTPLNINGPGAGVAITAGAVLADLVDAAARLANQRR